jgi:hypothetical protein
MQTQKPTLGLIVLLLLASLTPLFASGENEIVQTESGEGRLLRVNIEEGESFRHRMKIAPLIHIKNSPQMALWCETEEGEFLSTLFVTERAANSSWRKAPGDPSEKGAIARPSALPVWFHASSYTAAKEPLTVQSASDEQAPGGGDTGGRENADAVSSATPKKNFTILCSLPSTVETKNHSLQLYFEVNNSTDFNDYYRKDAEKGSPAYSGGPWGSGQPSLIYRAEIPASLLRTDSNSESGPEDASISFRLAGRGSPDGSNGRIHEDFSHISSARHIITDISAVLQ